MCFITLTRVHIKLQECSFASCLKLSQIYIVWSLQDNSCSNPEHQMSNLHGMTSRGKVAARPELRLWVSSLSFWAEPCCQLQFEQMAHNHTEGVLSQRKWPNIWQQTQRWQFELDLCILGFFFTGHHKDGKRRQKCYCCRCEKSIKVLPWQIQMGPKLQTCSGNDYISSPLPAELILSEKSCIKWRVWGNYKVVSYSVMWFQLRI